MTLSILNTFDPNKHYVMLNGCLDTDFKLVNKNLFRRLQKHFMPCRFSADRIAQKIYQVAKEKGLEHVLEHKGVKNFKAHLYASSKGMGVGKRFKWLTLGHNSALAGYSTLQKLFTTEEDDFCFASEKVDLVFRAYFREEYIFDHSVLCYPKHLNSKVETRFNEEPELVQSILQDLVNDAQKPSKKTTRLMAQEYYRIIKEIRTLKAKARLIQLNGRTISYTQKDLGQVREENFNQPSKRLQAVAKEANDLLAQCSLSIRDKVEPYLADVLNPALTRGRIN